MREMIVYGIASWLAFTAAGAALSVYLSPHPIISAGIGYLSGQVGALAGIALAMRSGA